VRDGCRCWVLPGSSRWATRDQQLLDAARRAGSCWASTTGWSRWTTCGHPPALLARDGRVVKALDSVVGAPLGLGLLAEHPQIASERLEPGDRLLLYTDGVIEARDTGGEFFAAERLVEFTARQAADGRPVAETLRRLSHLVLAHQAGALQDDATTVLIEWLTEEPTRTLLKGRRGNSDLSRPRRQGGPGRFPAGVGRRDGPVGRAAVPPR